MNTSRADLKKRIQSKIEEGYEKGGKLVEMGEVALYPEPAPSVDPTVQGSGKTIQVDSDLLRDLLNWATSADAGSIDAVVAKAEEVGAAGPLTPEHLIDLTATAQTADPSNPSCGAAAQVPQAGITSPVVPAGPVGPLSPVMASFMRRGKKVEELVSLPKMDKTGAQQVGGTGKMPVKAAIALDKQVKGHEKRTGKKFDGTQDTLMGIGEEDGEPEVDTRPEDMHDHGDDQKNRHLDDEKAEDMFESQDEQIQQIFDALVAKGISPKAAKKIIGNAEMEDLTTMYHELVMQAGEGEVVAEDDIIDSDNEAIVNPDEMRKPATKPLPKAPVASINRGNKGIAEDDVIPNVEHEPIVTPSEMGKKNPGVKPDGGQTPTGMNLGDKLNKGNKGIAEDGIDDAAGAIADGIGDAIAGEEGDEGAEGMVEPDAAMAGIPGEEIPQVGDAIDAVIGAEPMAPVGGEGLVGQVASLEARIAELEALLGSGEEAGEVPVGIPGIEAGEEGEEGKEDELTVDADDAEDEDGEGDAEGEEEEESEEGEEAGEKPEEKEEDGEEGDEKPVDDKKLFLGGEEEEKEEK